MAFAGLNSAKQHLRLYKTVANTAKQRSSRFQRRLWELDAAGSNPVTRTKNRINLLKCFFPNFFLPDTLHISNAHIIPRSTTENTTAIDEKYLYSITYLVS